MKRFLKQKLKTYFFAGLLVVGPIGMTVAVIHWVVSRMDLLLNLVLPPHLQPDKLFGVHIPGVGLAVSILLILLAGVFAANYLGRTLVTFSERLMYNIPLVKSIYTLFKQLADTTLGKNRKGFRQVVLIEYPRRGLWALGFVTGVTEGEIQRVTEKLVLNVFVPTTPNPTSGFYILVPEDDAVPLEMTVDDAFKLIISGGMVMPPEKIASRRRLAAKPAEPQSGE